MSTPDTYLAKPKKAELVDFFKSPFEQGNYELVSTIKELQSDIMTLRNLIREYLRSENNFGASSPTKVTYGELVARNTELKNIEIYFSCILKNIVIIPGKDLFQIHQNAKESTTLQYDELEYLDNGQHPIQSVELCLNKIQENINSMDFEVYPEELSSEEKEQELEGGQLFSKTDNRTLRDNQVIIPEYQKNVLSSIAQLKLELNGLSCIKHFNYIIK